MRANSPSGRRPSWRWGVRRLTTFNCASRHFHSGEFLPAGLTAAAVTVVRFAQPAHQGLLLGCRDPWQPNFIVWCPDQISVVVERLVVRVISARNWSSSVCPRSRLARSILTPGDRGAACLGAKNLVRSATGLAWMAVRDMDVAAAVIGIRLHAGQWLLAFAGSAPSPRRGWSALRILLSGIGGAGTAFPDLSFRILS